MRRSMLAAAVALALGACLQPVGDPDELDGGVARRDAGHLPLDAGPLLPDAGPPLPDSGCGDPLAAARLPSCRVAQDQTACEAAGGTWATGPFGEIFCSCPTGQGDCPCTTGAQCLTSRCVAEIPGSGFDGCKDVKSGKCPAYNVIFGCFCELQAGAPASALCVD